MFDKQKNVASMIHHRLPTCPRSIKTVTAVIKTDIAGNVVIPRDNCDILDIVSDTTDLVSSPVTGVNCPSCALPFDR